MVAQIALLRAINLGSRNRISMPELRRCLTEVGFKDVRTYLQSGNVVMVSSGSPTALAQKCKRAIADNLGLDIEVIVRTRDELAEVVRRNPLRNVATDPKRYQVSFMVAEPEPAAIAKLEAAVVAPEQFVVIGREAYVWHPAVVARSRLWNQLAGNGLGVAATARNWTTVTNVLRLADEVS